MNLHKNKLYKKEAVHNAKKHRTNTITKLSTYPRLIANKTNKFNYLQIVDKDWKVLASACDIKTLSWTKTESASNVWKTIAKAALEKGVKKVVFDRNWNLYHGRIKAMAEGAREGGLEF